MVEQTILLVRSMYVESIAPAVMLFAFNVVIENEVASSVIFVEDAFDKEIAVYSPLEARKEASHTNPGSESFEDSRLFKS